MTMYRHHLKNPYGRDNIEENKEPYEDYRDRMEAKHKKLCKNCDNIIPKALFTRIFYANTYCEVCGVLFDPKKYKP